MSFNYSMKSLGMIWGTFPKEHNFFDSVISSLSIFDVAAVSLVQVGGLPSDGWVCVINKESSGH